MDVSLLLKKVIPLLPGYSRFAKVDIAELSGGITNKNYRVSICGKSYVLSVGGRSSTKHLGIDRKAESQNMGVAHQYGITPEVVFTGGNMIVHRFVEGRVLRAGEITQQPQHHQFTKLIERCHRIPLAEVRGRFCVFDNVEHLMREGGRLGARLPNNAAWILLQLTRIRQAISRHPLKPVFCHNDLVPENIIVTPTRMVLIDWEYSGVGDRFFDLGMAAAYHQMNDRQEQELLGAYFGKVTDGSLARLRLMRMMSPLRDGAWSLVQVAVSSLDFDFAAYGKERFRRFSRLCERTAFEDWLRITAASPIEENLQPLS